MQSFQFKNFSLARSLKEISLEKAFTLVLSPIPYDSQTEHQDFGHSTVSLL